MKYILLILFFLPLLGCYEFFNQEWDIELPSEELLVVHSFISPDDSLITVILNVSERINDDKANKNNYDPYSLDNVIVILSDGVKSIEIPRYGPSSKEFEIAQSLFPLQNGKTYYLEILRGGDLQCRASTTIPDYNIPAEYVEFFNKRRIQEDSVVDISITVPKDAPIDFFATGINLYFSNTRYQQLHSWFPHQIYNVNNKKDSTYYLPKVEYSGTIKFNDNSVGYSTFVLITADQSFYNYFTTAIKYAFNQETLVLEPFRVKSNIEGGFGVFAGYAVTEVRL